MKKKRMIAYGLAAAAVLLVWGLAVATDAELYFSTDKNGANRVTKVQEGEQIWICVVDPDEDIDCNDRDKIWTDVKVMDAKTGAHIVWKSYKDENGDANGKKFGEAGYTPYKGHFPGPTAGWLGGDYLEETDASTGLFVSSRPFQIGTRVGFSHDGRDGAHITGPYDGTAPGAVSPTDFEWGGYLYADADGDGVGDERVWVDATHQFVRAMDNLAANHGIPSGSAYLPSDTSGTGGQDYVLGRFENMDTIVGLYVDPNDAKDVAVAQGKIIDTVSQVAWDKEVYPDGREAATLTVTDPDENLNCDAVEYVPVFIIVNPGSWNPLKTHSATNFCSLKRYGGVKSLAGDVLNQPIEWYSIYDSGLKTTDVDLAADGSNQPNADGTYYIEYPTESDDNVTWFDTASDSGVTRVMFYAQETGADTGVFTLRLNHINHDLGFKHLNVHDVLVAYYTDPNDQDDFNLATAYIGERAHSVTSFTDADRNDQGEFWLGRTPVYVQVTDSNANTDACCPEKVVVHVCDPHEVDDSEWLVLDETSSNSPVFFMNAGMKLGPVWDALGTSPIGANGGYSLQLDNWTLEGFNEDAIYARYNDVAYTDETLVGLGDSDPATSFPPTIKEVRVANDVSFDVIHVADTEVTDYDGATAMYFLDRNGNRVTGYANSDCLFVELVDPDQDEDRYRRERIDAFWDGGQSLPFGPWDYDENHADSCGFEDEKLHPVNDLLGDTNIFTNGQFPKLYVLNPRNGRWAAFDLLETGVGTGDFVSVTCIDLVSQYSCVPTLGVLPGDTLIAVYQDPSNHSDITWTSIKVAVGGGQPQGSTTEFTDASGTPVDAYTFGESAYVTVLDPSVSGAGTLPGAVRIDGQSYDLAPLVGAPAGTFITGPIPLTAPPGSTITAVYTDPSDPSDTSSDKVQIVAAELYVDRFYAGPNPFSDTTAFGYAGTGLAVELTVTVYDLAGRLVWEGTRENALSIPWDGTRTDGNELANGPYVYVITATDGTNTFSGRGTVFIRR